MKIFNLLFILALVAYFNTSCTRKGAELSSIRIKIPDKEMLTKKVSTLETGFPSNKKLCFGINVTGPGIDSRTAECAPLLGITKGFVSAENNSEITMEVPRGTNRNFEIYFYAQDLNSLCPEINGSRIDSSLVYQVGLATNMNIQNAEERIEINVKFPGDSNNIIATLNLPASCSSKGSTPNSTIGQIRISPTIEQTAAGIKIRSMISSTSAVKQISSDSSIQIKAQIKLNP